jgi:hypothetical protein
MEPTFYQHVVKQSLIHEGSKVDLRLVRQGQWAVVRGGLFQSTRNKWHRLSHAKGFWNNHAYPYEEALKRARTILDREDLMPVDSQVQVSVSDNPTAIDFLSVHLLLKRSGHYVASTPFNAFIDANGRQEVEDRRDNPRAYKPQNYLTTREDAFERAVKFLKKTSVNGRTIYNSGSAILSG